MKTNNKHQQKRCITAIALLAMALSFMSQVTPLWLKQSNGTDIVICTAFGTQTITIDENGKQLPNLPKDIKNHCTMCLVAASTISPAISIFSDITQPPAKTHQIRWKYVNTYISDKSKFFGHTIRAPPLNA